MTIRIFSLIKTIFSCFLLTYFVSYVILSCFGNYTQHYVYMGPENESFENHLFDYRNKKKVWQPLGILNTVTYSNKLGKLYYPLIIVDRYIWHRSIKMINE